MVVWRSTFPPGLVCMAIAIVVVGGGGGWRCARWLDGRERSMVYRVITVVAV